MIERYSEEYERLYEALAKLPPIHWVAICEGCFPLIALSGITVADVIDEINSGIPRCIVLHRDSTTYLINDIYHITVWHVV